MDDESLHQILALKKHPVWQLLRARWEEVKQDEINKFGRKVVNTGQPIDPAEAAKASGRWRGIFEVLDTPEWAETELRVRKEHEGSNP